MSKHRSSAATSLSPDVLHSYMDASRISVTARAQQLMSSLCSLSRTVTRNAVAETSLSSPAYAAKQFASTGDPALSLTGSMLDRVVADADTLTSKVDAVGNGFALVDEVVDTLDFRGRMRMAKAANREKPSGEDVIKGTLDGESENGDGGDQSLPSTKSPSADGNPGRVLQRFWTADLE
ncbi:hypothetical protein M427DRAFT_64015 [Gonapodya prolifera JEL478]|uniref:Uncharacterized protein n=1 Tax=Gonapodya prolifera (strain JEL478) TaxID=1344416 RepID=A0A138ZYD7_GONPJ|nr:hypothetical protein M427DRAFT_64015 [Gonapodya prolifera JEL478]|eukprot:KXS09500.1 hypothetical protein M427DRAFT_64015 [Gonapodya prolifera JEL478]